MNQHQTWQARYDSLRADLTRIGAVLGDKRAPYAERSAAGREFVAVWGTLCAHIKQQPPTVAHALPG